MLGYFDKAVNCLRILAEIAATFSLQCCIQPGSRVECLRRRRAIASSREFLLHETLAQVLSDSIRVLVFSPNPAVCFLIHSFAPKGNHQVSSNLLYDLVALCSLIAAEVLILCTLMHTNVP